MIRLMLLQLIDLFIYAATTAISLIVAHFSGFYEFLSFRKIIICAIIMYFCILIARFSLRIYQNLWRHATSAVYLKFLAADLAGGLVGYIGAVILKMEYPLFIGLVIIAFSASATVFTRIAYREYHNRVKKHRGTEKNKINVAIVGAGKVGTMLVSELTVNTRSFYKPYCFIDSDTKKVGSYIHGLKIYPENEDIIDFIKSQPISEIFIAIPRLSGTELKELYEFYLRTGCKVKIYDLPIQKLNEKNIKASPDEEKRELREFKIEDLLFRRTLEINDAQSKHFYYGKTVLVTGGGGSIGSEICRQIAKCSPKKLIILDIYENNAYEIQQELYREYGSDLDLAVEIASVRDVARLDCVFHEYRPQIVFHAAAHKHVPLMEHSSCEAIKNNVFGTFNAANAAEKYGVENFILISTDKAVNPTNVMGASKRMCEMIVQSRSDSQTSFCAVRFGNVLGSNGSVIPLFKKQIEQGGPVTVTDKRIIRYFMTIPEASQLCLQAGAMANSGELFVLDMGNPVKILDLAESMIRIYGYEPYKDIDIVEIGLRDGEKLYEELLIKTEKMSKTLNDMIFIETDLPHTREEISKKLEVLRSAVEDNADELCPPSIRDAMMSVVPTFKDPNVVNSACENEQMISEFASV